MFDVTHSLQFSSFHIKQMISLRESWFTLSSVHAQVCQCHFFGILRLLRLALSVIITWETSSPICFYSLSQCPYSATPPPSNWYYFQPLFPVDELTEKVTSWQYQSRPPSSLTPLIQFGRKDTLRRDVCIADERTEGTNSQTFIINYGWLYLCDLFPVEML